MPSRMALDHDFALSVSLVNPPSTLVCALALVGLFYLACRIVRKHRFIGFCVFGFFIHLVLESLVSGLDPVFEHRLYLPSIMACAIFASLVFSGVKNRNSAIAFMCTVCLIFSLGAWQRNGYWADDVALWSDNVKKTPKNKRAYSNLGVALARQGRMDEAIDFFFRALTLEPDYSEAHLNLGVIFKKQGLYDKAIHHFDIARKKGPGSLKALCNLGWVLDQTGRTEDAVTC